MAAKPPSGFSLKLTGPGVSVDRPVSEEVANLIINLAMTGTTNLHPAANSSSSSSGFSLSPQNQKFPMDLTIKQFIAQKRPENLYQRVACLAYFLTHISEIPHFKTKDISQANTDAAASKFSNAAAFVNDATNKYGYLSAAGGGNKQITAYGEQIVDALPDRDKVKQLQENNKPRIRKKTKRKPKWIDERSNSSELESSF